MKTTSSMFSLYPLVAALRQQRNHLGGVANFEPQNPKQRALVRAFNLEHERVAELLGVQSMITDDQEVYRTFIAMHAIRFPGIDPLAVTIPNGSLGVAGVLDLDIAVSGQADLQASSGGVQYVNVNHVYFSASQFADSPLAKFDWAGNVVRMTPRDGLEAFKETDAQAQQRMIDCVFDESKSVRLRKRDRGTLRRLQLPELCCSVAHALDWLKGFRIVDGAGMTQEVASAYCGVHLRLRTLNNETDEERREPFHTFSGSLLLSVERSTLEDPLLTAVLYPQDSWVKTHK